MEFEWDDKKNVQNISKHVIDFEDVKQVFRNDMVVKEDKRNDYGEKRFVSIGLMNNIEVVIVWTIREKRIRIISARKANSTERGIYHENIN